MGFIVVTSERYPKRVVFNKLIPEASACMAWSAPARDVSILRVKTQEQLALADMAQDFDNLEQTDKLTKLQNEMDELKQLMQRNLEKALGNLESLREAERASKALEDAAKGMQEGARTLAWREWCMLQKVKFIALAIALLLIIIIVAAICGTPGACGGNSG